MEAHFFASSIDVYKRQVYGYNWHNLFDASIKQVISILSDFGSG